MLLENSACFEIVQAVGGFDEAVDHDLGVAAAIGGIDAVAGFEVAEALEGGVIVGEEFDEGAFEFAGFCRSGEEGGDPAIVGGEAAAGRWNGAVEGSEHSGVGELGDEGFVLRDIEIGVATVGGIDEDAEEGGANLGKESLHDGHYFFERGEIGKLAGTEELDVPVFDTGIGQATFAISAGVEFDVLSDTGLKFFGAGGLGSAHPLLDGGGVYLLYVVAKGRANIDLELGEGGVFIGWVVRVCASDHHNELRLEADGADLGEEFVHVSGNGGAEGGNLNGVNLDRGEFANVAGSGKDDQFTGGIAREVALVIGYKGFEKAEVRAENSKFDA